MACGRVAAAALPHPLLRRPARLRAAPITSGPNAAPVSAARAVVEQCQQGGVSGTGVDAVQHAVQQAGPHGMELPAEAVFKQARRYEWAGLREWRARGIDRRLRWSPPPPPPTSPSLSASPSASPSGGGAGGAPALVPPGEAPTLGSVLPPGQPPPASMLQAGLAVLRTPCPRSKAALTHAAWAAYLSGQLPLRAPGDDGGDGDGGAGHGSGSAGPAAAELALGQEGGAAAARQPPLVELLPARPARPERPRLVRPKDIPSHDACPLGLSGYMLHNLAHIELNAIDLAWDTVVRFAPLRLPDQFYEDFARVADDESRHLGWCLQRLAELGAAYGDMDAHDLLWQGCADSAVDVAARLAVVPMSQEARGLDAGSRLVARLVGCGDARSAAVVGAIAAEERAHVAVGVTWFARICAAAGVQPGPLFRHWLLSLNPDLLKGPFNHSERGLVGLPRDWYDPAAWPQQGTLTTAESADAVADSNAASAAVGSGGSDSGSGGGGGGGGQRAAAAAVQRPSAPEGQVSSRRQRQGAGPQGPEVEKVSPPRGPVRGRPHPRLSGPPPLLRPQQLAALAERLALFAEVEGHRAGEGQCGAAG